MIIIILSIHYTSNAWGKLITMIGSTEAWREKGSNEAEGGFYTGVDVDFGTRESGTAAQNLLDPILAHVIARRVHNLAGTAELFIDHRGEHPAHARSQWTKVVVGLMYVSNACGKGTSERSEKETAVP